MSVENSSDAGHAAAPLTESAAKAFKPRGITKITRTAILLLVLGGIGYVTVPWLQARWTHVLLDDARIAANMIAVSSEVSGKIALLPVIAGDTVRQGQVLATIDTSTVNQELRGLEAQVEGVKSQQSQSRAQQAFIKGQIASKLVASAGQIEASIASHAAAEAALGCSGGEEKVSIWRRIAGSCSGNPGVSGYGIIVTPIGLSSDSEREFVRLHWTKAAILASCQLPCHIASDCPVLTLNGGGLKEL